ncbi:MAG: alpha/beta hydrolase [Thermoanaerobaculia bacterium]
MKRPARLSDLQGAARLAVEATIGVTDLVESVHHSVTHLPGKGPVPGSSPSRQRGISGFVYRTVRRITRWVGSGADLAFTRLGPALEPPSAGEETAEAASLRREALVAALNGVLGDHLEASANPLAIPMRFRRGGRELDPARESGGRVLLLLHGLCRADLQWRRHGHDHGERLAAELGFAPVYLHYNSGRAIAANGRELARRLEELLAAWGAPVDELLAVGHSMGGLVMRAACRVAESEGLSWRRRLRKIVFLGTPHHGAPLERGGNWVNLALDTTSYTAAFARLGRMRSAGITDLRHGRLGPIGASDPESQEDRFARGSGEGAPLPLPAGVVCYAFAATLAPDPAAPAEASAAAGRRRRLRPPALLGDGLVPLASALGDHPDPARDLAIPAARRAVGYAMSHLDLLDRPEVYARIRAWLSAPGALPPAT